MKAQKKTNYTLIWSPLTKLGRETRWADSTNHEDHTGLKAKLITKEKG